jgi:hypothetical protein
MLLLLINHTHLIWCLGRLCHLCIPIPLVANVPSSFQGAAHANLSLAAWSEAQATEHQESQCIRSPEKILQRYLALPFLQPRLAQRTQHRRDGSVLLQLARSGDYLVGSTPSNAPSLCTVLLLQQSGRPWRRRRPAAKMLLLGPGPPLVGVLRRGHRSPRPTRAAHKPGQLPRSRHVRAKTGPTKGAALPVAQEEPALGAAGGAVSRLTGCAAVPKGHLKSRSWGLRGNKAVHIKKVLTSTHDGLLQLYSCKDPTTYAHITVFCEPS